MTKMIFKNWLVEMENKGYEYYKNILLGKLSPADGLSQGLNTWEPEQLVNMLNSLGEFKKLRQEIQDQVIGKVRSKMGTLNDLITLMSSSPTIGDNG